MKNIKLDIISKHHLVTGDSGESCPRFPWFIASLIDPSYGNRVVRPRAGATSRAMAHMCNMEEEHFTEPVTRFLLKDPI